MEGSALALTQNLIILRVQKKHFVKISFLITGNRISFRYGREGLKKCLTPAFLDALKEQSPQDLFDEYGTHIAAAIKTGGKAEYFCRSSDTMTMSSNDFVLAATAKYLSLGGEGHVPQSDSRTQQDVIGSESLFTLGGDADLAARISATGGWAEWAKSCHDSPAFLGFDMDGGLIPIWELTEDPNRRALLRTAYLRRAAKELRTHIMSVTSDPPTGHPEARTTIPDGYKLLSGGALDDWSGAGNLLTSSFPESNNTWRASGKDHTIVSPAKITAYAIVTYDPDDIWDIAQSSSISPQKEAHPSHQVSVKDGYTLIGGGVQVHWSSSGSLLTACYPRDDGKTWACAAKDHLVSDPSTITAYAISLKCNVNGLRVLQHIQKSSSNPEPWPRAAASPRSGYSLVGGGAAANWSVAGSLLTASYPSSERTWEGRSKDHGVAEPVILDVYAVAVKVVDLSS
jgi:MAC/Perforin domain